MTDIAKHLTSSKDFSMVMTVVRAAIVCSALGIDPQKDKDGFCGIVAQVSDGMKVPRRHVGDLGVLFALIFVEEGEEGGSSKVEMPMWFLDAVAWANDVDYEGIDLSNISSRELFSKLEETYSKMPPLFQNETIGGFVSEVQRISFENDDEWFATIDRLFCKFNRETFGPTSIN